MRTALHHDILVQHQPAAVLSIREHAAVHPPEDAFDADREDRERQVLRIDRRRMIRRTI